MDKIAAFFSNLFGGVLDWVVELLNGVLGGAVSIISDWLSSLGFSITIPSDVFSVFNELTYGIGYIFPIAALLPIPTLMLGFYIAKIIFSVYSLIASTIIKRIKVKV